MADSAKSPLALCDDSLLERNRAVDEPLVDRSARRSGSPWARPVRRLVIHESRRLVVVRLNEIDWIEGAGNYVRVHVGAKSRLHRQTLAELHGCLDPRSFARVHRSAIVRLDAIAQIERDASGGMTVELRNGGRVAVSRRYRRELAHRLEMP